MLKQNHFSTNSYQPAVSPRITPKSAGDAYRALMRCDERNVIYFKLKLNYIYKSAACSFYDVQFTHKLTVPKLPEINELIKIVNQQFLPQFTSH
jgi:hypothetical protein